jgi:hypothetical protein
LAVPEISVNAGPSKLNNILPVLASPPTVTTAVPKFVVIESIGASHLTAVNDDHSEVLHGTNSIACVAVRSAIPKPSPCTVSDAPPVFGAFRITNDATAASNVNPAACVPTTPPTVTP